MNDLTKEDLKTLKNYINWLLLPPIGFNDKKSPCYRWYEGFEAALNEVKEKIRDLEK